MKKFLVALLLVLGVIASVPRETSAQWVSSGVGCKNNCTFTGTMTLGGQASWSTGLGAINQIQGPTDQGLVIAAGSGRTARLVNNGGSGIEIGSVNGGLRSTSAAANDLPGAANFLHFMVNGVDLCSSTAPTISSGFGTSPSIISSNGNCTFRVGVGTGGVATSGVISVPAATTGWNCSVWDLTNLNTGTRQTASTTTTITVTTNAAWTASDTLVYVCKAF